jgi:hypothetical protein
MFLTPKTQAQIPVGLEERLTLNTIPEKPGANQDVYAEIESYAIDLSRSQVTWLINGVIKKQGFGERTFSFKTGPLGSSMNLRVVAISPQGQSIEEEIVIQTSEVDLIWKADSYTPPFYKGKALFP